MALLLVLAALALRLYGIDANGLWNDEGGTARYSSLPVGRLVATIAAEDPHPPLYYLVVHFWTLVAGPSDFAIRLPSALFGALTVAALYALGRRVGGRAVAALAALFAAASPLLVWYDQEARMYALLVLGATLSTLLLHRARQRGAWSAWLLHGAVLATTLHVHYFAAFLAAWHGVLVERATRWRPDRWRALLAIGLAAAAFVPWLLTTDTLGYQGWMEPVDFETALRRAAWAFAVGTSIYPEWGWLLSAPILVAAALGVVALALRRPRADLWLIGGWAVVPVLASYAFGAVTGRPSFHERYVIAGAPGVLLLAALGVAGLAARWPRGMGRATGLAGATVLAAGVLAADARSLAWHYTDPHFAKEDVRAAARFVDARAAPEDGLLAAPGRADLYDRYGRVPLEREVTDVAPHELEPLLEQFVAGKPRVWYLPHDADIDRQAEAWLDARFYRVDDRWFGLAPLKSWLLAADPPGPGETRELTWRGAPAVRVAALRHAVAPAPDGHLVRVVGEWSRIGDLPTSKASLRLVDGHERTVAQRDLPLGGQLSPIDAWPAGEPRALRFALRVPLDVPGGSYSLRLVVYADEPLLAGGQPEWRLGDLTLEPRAGSPPQVEPKVAADARLGGQLRLIGHDLPTAAVPAGGKGTAVLHWHALAPGAWSALADSRVLIGGLEASEGADPATIAGAAPGPGTVLREARELRVPRQLSAGAHDLSVRVGDHEVVVGRVEVAQPVGRPIAGPTFAADATFGPADLVGFDAKGEVRPAGRVAIGLHFAPKQPFQRDLKVFVHLLDEAGKIVAQHDGQPCGGACPTSAWRGGERILSEHPLELPPTLAPGQYAVVVGLYDGRTGDRVPRAGPTPPGESDRAILGELTVPA